MMLIHKIKSTTREFRGDKKPTVDDVMSRHDVTKRHRLMNSSPSNEQSISADDFIGVDDDDIDDKQQVLFAPDK
jgi:hypothetical protein